MKEQDVLVFADFIGKEVNLAHQLVSVILIESG